MRPCYFCKVPADLEMRDGLIIITPEQGECAFAVTPHTLQKMVANYNRILDEWHERRIVVPIKAP